LKGKPMDEKQKPKEMKLELEITVGDAEQFREALGEYIFDGTKGKECPDKRANDEQIASFLNNAVKMGVQGILEWWGQKFHQEQQAFGIRSQEAQKNMKASAKEKEGIRIVKQIKEGKIN